MIFFLLVTKKSARSYTLNDTKSSHRKHTYLHFAIVSSSNAIHEHRARLGLAGDITDLDNGHCVLY